MKVTILIISLLFIIIYSFLPLSTPAKFTSPDETANYFFSKLYAETGSLKIIEPSSNNNITIVHPRSTTVVNNFLVPASFLGLPIIYGLIGGLLGVWIIPFLTPVFVAISGIAFFYLMKNIFQRLSIKQYDLIALSSAILYLTHPAVWYYSSRTMFHNMLFVALLIIGAYFLERFFYYLDRADKNEQTVRKHLALASFFIALSLTVRTAEIIWVSFVLLFLWLWNYKKIRFLYIVIDLGIMILVFLPILYYNHDLYGKWYASGYNTNYTLDSNHALYNSLEDKPASAFVNFYNYFVVLFWWIFALFAIGLCWFLRATKKLQWCILIPTTLTIGWLIFFYGSFNLHDTLGKDEITIGTSYARYWLPIYIVTIPFIGFFIVQLASLYNRFKNTIIYVALGIIVLLSGRFVFVDATENIISTKKTILDNQTILDIARQVIPQDSIVISEHEDKIFFPEFRVVNSSQGMTIKDDTVIKGLSFLVWQNQLYYYNSLPKQALEHIDQTKLKPAGLKFGKKKYLISSWQLDKIERVD